LELSCSSEELTAAVKAHQEMICKEALAKEFVLHAVGAQPSGKHVEKAEFDELSVSVGVTPLKG
jgi:hypothetical protein